MAVKPAWMPAGLGASPKKLAVLGGLVALLGYVAWSNLRSDDSAPAASTLATTTQSVAPLKKLPDPQTAADNAVASTSSSGPMPARRTGSRDSNRNVEEFRPTLKPKEDMDVSKVDPTLRTELLDKVRQVGMVGGARNLFEFSKPPEPPAPKITLNPGPVPPPVVKASPPPPPPAPAGPPPAPPIPLKYFGYAGAATAREGKLRGLFLEGDPNTGEYYVAGENEMVKGRYKILRIGIKSAELEDTTNNHQQTLPLVDEQSQ